MQPAAINTPWATRIGWAPKNRGMLRAIPAANGKPLQRDNNPEFRMARAIIIMPSSNKSSPTKNVTNPGPDRPADLPMESGRWSHDSGMVIGVG
jgi:hypothetical protein